MGISLLSCFGLVIEEVKAYPQFIGYKYSSCLTCHFNGQGNGPLNDYGRAYWATEIAGRLWSSGKSVEQLGESSGVLGAKALPWWIRPGAKVRQLWFVQNPGGTNSVERSILMQADVNAAVFLDESQKYTFVGAIGYVPKPEAQSGGTQKYDNWISREHYFRWQGTENLWVYLGLMDKVYGIRHADHTAYSRSRTGIAQNDQSHGIVAHYIRENWEATLNLFLGNYAQDEELRQKGGSTLVEYDVKENWRVGLTALVSSNKYVAHRRYALLSRVGYGMGAALLFEGGVIQNEPKGQKNKNGYYIYSETLQRIARGYHVFLVGQAYKQEMIGSVDDDVSLGFGMLAFPMQRLELRVEARNTRHLPSGNEVQTESWAIQLQGHLSL